MLKRKYIIFIIGIVLFFSFFGYSFIKIIKLDNNLIFSYPKGNIDFAGEIVSMSGRNYLNKQKFDKEFLISGNSLYQFYLYVKRYPLYIPYIEKELKKAGIPDDFKYLPIAESALREDVVSPVGAAGIWQFMPETAKRFGLKIDDYIDERYNFNKSTKAAIEYINFLYNKFGNWTLAAAAYNRGEGGISKALKSQKVNDYYSLYLNNETSRYIFRIIAIKYLLEDYFTKKGLIDPVIGGVYKKPDIKIIEVNNIENLSSWSIENGQNYKTVKNLNPWILGNSLPKGDWKIKILK